MKKFLMVLLSIAFVLNPQFQGVQAAPIHPEMPALAWPNLLAINLLNLNEMDHLRFERGSHQITLCIAS